MAKLKFLFLVLSVLTLTQNSFCSIDTMWRCLTLRLVNLTGEIPDELEQVKKFGYVFPWESIVDENGEMFGFICYGMPCTGVCDDLAMASVKDVCVEDNHSSKVLFSPFLLNVEENLTDSGIDDRYSRIFTSIIPTRKLCKLIQPEGKMSDRYNFTDKIYYRKPDAEAGKYFIGAHEFDGFCVLRDLESFDYRLTLCKVHKFEFRPSILRVTKVERTFHTLKTKVMSYGTIVSIPFLLMTFVVYTILPEMKNIHGLTLRGYVGCLAVGYTALAVVENNRPLRPKFLCHFSGFAIQFSFLASFFWLNVMCFDIWWSFRSLLSSQKDVKQRKQRIRKKFIVYSAYVWGCTILFTVVCAIMNYVPGIPKTVIRPKFGLPKYCWFKSNKAKALYFYGPMGVTVLCNIFFFKSTAVNIIRAKKDAAQHFEGTDSKRHDNNKQWFNLYLKLFIVMGVNWATEIISWLCGGPEFLWYVTDLVNALQGVIIFVIFICKKQIKDSLTKRFRF